MVGLVVLLFLIIMSNKEEQGESNPVLPVIAAEQNEETQHDNTVIMVDVKGEVSQPGVYEVDSHARINDVIILAGGFTDDADVLPVNLAQRVQDEMTIIVPKIGETDVLSDYTNNNSSGDGKVRINYATSDELETLSGIGPSKAQAIIQYRDEYGFFEKEEDLLNISGIGEKTLDNIRDDIQVP